MSRRASTRTSELLRPPISIAGSLHTTRSNAAILPVKIVLYFHVSSLCLLVWAGVLRRHGRLILTTTTFHSHLLLDVYFWLCIGRWKKQHFILHFCQDTPLRHCTNYAAAARSCAFLRGICAILNGLAFCGIISVLFAIVMGWTTNENAID